MGYSLKAFIGRSADLEKIESKLRRALIVALTDEIALVPMTEGLFNEINNFRRDNAIGKFECLTTDVEDKILDLIDNRMIAYIEVEYYGGEGSQSGIIWKEGSRIFDKNLEQEVVNEILQQFGVVRSKGKDEFATVGLDRKRKTADWI